MPAPSLSVQTIYATAVDLALGSFAADGTVEIQVSTRADFKNCVCPVQTGWPRTSPAAVTGLNQNTSYYVRARSRRASGAAEDWSGVAGFRTALSTGQDLSTPAVLIHPAMLVVPVPVINWAGDNDIAGFPASNLAFDAPVAWQSRTALSSTTASFLIQTAMDPIDTIALLMSNAPENATVRILAGQTSGTAAYDSGNLPFRASANLPGRPGYHCLVRLPAPQTYAFWRVNFSFPTGLTGCFHLQHAVFGLNRVSKNHSVDKAEAGIDLGTLERGRSGIPARTLGHRGRRVDFEISMMNQVQYETQYADLPRLVGSTQPVLVVPNSRAGTFLHDRILYGALSGGRAVNPASPVFTRSFTVDSILP